MVRCWAVGTMFLTGLAFRRFLIISIRRRGRLNRPLAPQRIYARRRNVRLLAQAIAKIAAIVTSGQNGTVTET